MITPFTDPPLVAFLESRRPCAHGPSSDEPMSAGCAPHLRALLWLVSRTAELVFAAPPRRGGGTYREGMASIGQDVRGGADLQWERMVAGLSDLELQEELMAAAMARGERRLDRFRFLLCERKRRWEDRQR
jgi:hypothetical protein